MRLHRLVQGADLLLGVTVDNVAARARVLKRHEECDAIAGVWAKFRKLLSQDDSLLNASYT